MVFQAKDLQITADSSQPARVSKQEVQKGAVKPMSKGVVKMRPQPRGKTTGNAKTDIHLPFPHNHHYPGKLGADGGTAVCTKPPSLRAGFAKQAAGLNYFTVS